MVMRFLQVVRVGHGLWSVRYGIMEISNNKTVPGIGLSRNTGLILDNESYGLFCCAMLLRITGSESAIADIPAAPLSAPVD